MPHQYWYWLLNIGYQFSSCGISIREWRITFYSVGIHLITVEVCHSEESVIPKAVIQGLRGIVLDIVSYYLAIGRLRKGGHPPRCQNSLFTFLCCINN